MDAGLEEDPLLDDAATEEFEPFALPVDFELPGGRGEGEVGFYPSHLQLFSDGSRVSLFGCVEDSRHKPFKSSLEMCGQEADFLVMVYLLFWVGVLMERWIWVFYIDESMSHLSHLLPQILKSQMKSLEEGNTNSRAIRSRAAPESRALHLMEYWEVASVDAIATKDICADGVAIWGIRCLHGSECMMLMCRGVSTENCVFIDIVGICGASTRVIRGKIELIEIGKGTNDRIGHNVVLIDWGWKE